MFRSIIPAKTMSHWSCSVTRTVVFLAVSAVCVFLLAGCGETDTPGKLPPTQSPAGTEKAVAGEATGSGPADPPPRAALDAPAPPPSDAASEEERVKACAIDAMEKCSMVLDDPKTHVACIKRNVTECSETQ